MRAFAFLIFNALAYAAKETSFPQIIDGADVPIGQYPYQVSLRFNNSHVCGGSILDKLNVLTSAQCVIRYKCSFDELKVHVGTNFLNESGYVYDVASISIHQNYDDSFLTNDIALIHLKSLIMYNKLVQRINLTTSEQLENKWCTVTGWGDKKLNETSNNLQEMKLLVISQKRCSDEYWRVVDSHICTDGIEGKGPCNGDDGGPLVFEGKQVGIFVSFNNTCGHRNPHVHTRVTSFRSWINANLKTEGDII